MEVCEYIKDGAKSRKMEVRFFFSDQLGLSLAMVLLCHGLTASIASLLLF